MDLSTLLKELENYHNQIQEQHELMRDTGKQNSFPDLTVVISNLNQVIESIRDVVGDEELS